MSYFTVTAHPVVYDHAAFFHNQSVLIHHFPLWVRDNLTTPEHMGIYANEICKRMERCWHFIFSPIQLNYQNDKYMTSVGHEISILGETLKNNVMTRRYYGIFKKIVLDKYDIFKTVDPRTLPAQGFLSQQLLHIEKCLSDKDWVNVKLDTEDKKQLFMGSILRLIELNFDILNTISSHPDESPWLIINRISTILPSEKMRNIFQKRVNKLYRPDERVQIEKKKVENFLEQVGDHHNPARSPVLNSSMDHRKPSSSKDLKFKDMPNKQELMKPPEQSKEMEVAMNNFADFMNRIEKPTKGPVLSKFLK